MRGRTATSTDSHVPPLWRRRAFRVPADYDGLVLAIDKDITDERDHYLTENGDFISSSDLYADILTRSDGTKQSADDFYFIRVSDLLEYFQSKH